MLTCFHRRLLLTALLGASLAGTNSPAIGADYFTLVPNGKFVAVGRVVIKAPVDGKLTGVSSGTGTLLAPDLVLTASHVIMDALAPELITFEVTLPNGKIWSTYTLAYRTHPQFLKVQQLSADENAVIDFDMTTVAASDIALLRLAAPLPEKIVFPELGALPSDPGTSVESVGFGQIEGPTGASAAKRSGKLEFYEKSSKCALFRAPPGKLQRTNHGDSGGPLLALDSGKEKIVAITHGYARYDKLKGLDPSSYGLYTPIEDNRGWIDRARSELESMRFAEGRYYYLLRKPNQNSGQLALTRQQIAGLLLVDVPEARVIGRVFSRGINEPIPEAVFQDWVKGYKLNPAEHFVPAQFAQPYFQQPAAQGGPK